LAEGVRNCLRAYPRRPAARLLLESPSIPGDCEGDDRIRTVGKYAPVRGPLMVRRASREHVIDSNVVSLEVASPVDADGLSELLDLYVGELSTLFAIEADVDGRFGYDKLPLYWIQPDRRFAFFIRSGKDRVGVALVTRESATNDAPEHLDVAEFFVLPAHRGRGIGRQAASLLWDRLPGQWVVRVSQANVAALPFWRNTVQSYTGGTFSVSERPGQPDSWHVFSFRSAGAPAI
jgi:predicted acetyltransferase